MSRTDASRITIDNSRMVLQIEASFTDNSRGVIYNRNMFIVQAPWASAIKLFTNFHNKMLS